MYYSLFDGEHLDSVKNMQSVDECAQAVKAWVETERTISDKYRDDNMKFLRDFDFHPFSHENKITEGYGVHKSFIAAKYDITMID